MRVILLGLLLLAGCTFYLGDPIPGAATQALDHADWAQVYELEPGAPSPNGAKQLDGFTVSQKDTLAGDSARAAGYTVENDIEEASGRIDCVFKPIQAVRVRWDYHTYDYLMDYECGLVEVFEDHHNLAWHGIDGNAADLNVIVSDAKIRPQPPTGK